MSARTNARTSDDFLRHVIANDTQYSPGWQQICQEFLDARVENAKLHAALVDCAHAGCPTAAESIAAIESSTKEDGR